VSPSPGLAVRDLTTDDDEESSSGVEGGDTPRRSRLRLDSLDRLRREMTKLYREGRDGTRNTQDVSRLANVLALIDRLIEGGDLEARIATLERARDQR
jgi:hypothetical protein